MSPLSSLRASYWILVLPALLLLAALYAVPVLSVLWLSVTIPEPGLANYAQLFTNETIARVLVVTIRVCLISTVITLLAGYVVAYVLIHVSERQRQYLLFFVLLPFWLSVLVRSFAWLILLGRQGVVNDTLISLGMIDQPLSLIRNEFGVIVGMVHYMLPYAVLPLFAGMRGIDGRLVFAARGLGFGPVGAFWRVFFPLSLPGVVSAAVLVFVMSLGFYVTPAILGGGKTVMIAEYIAFNILENIRWELATMLASVLLITIFAILFAVSRFFDLRRMFGAAA
ncbi:ABC transporter permease [Mesorhizobium loti]|nr:ABC transporter permease [Mesorhizobium loti]